jgi:hypothetical protein
MKESVTSEERAAAFASVGGICVHCLARSASELHHNPPRGGSRRKEVYLTPLCGPCHCWAHHNTSLSVPILKEELVRAKRLHKENNK